MHTYPRVPAKHTVLKKRVADVPQHLAHLKSSFSILPHSAGPVLLSSAKGLSQDGGTRPVKLTGEHQKLNCEHSLVLFLLEDRCGDGKTHLRFCLCVYGFIVDALQRSSACPLAL